MPRLTVLIIILLGLLPLPAQAAPLLLARLQMSLTQIVGCEPVSCFSGGGLSGFGLLEMVIDPETNHILAATPMFSVLEPFRNEPRLVRFSGEVSRPSSCDIAPDGWIPCFHMGMATMRQLEGTSAGAWRDFLIEPPGWRPPDPFYGILPTEGDLQEEGEIDGRHVWFWGGFQVESVTAVNSNLAPIPEPGSITLLGLGAVGLLLRRRRRWTRQRGDAQ